MTEILKDKSSRIIIAFGMYLLYELASKIIDNNYNFKITNNNKSFILQKQSIENNEFNHSNKDLNT